MAHSDRNLNTCSNAFFFYFRRGGGGGRIPPFTTSTVQIFTDFESLASDVTGATVAVSGGGKEFLIKMRNSFIILEWGRFLSSGDRFLIYQSRD